MVPLVFAPAARPSLPLQRRVRATPARARRTPPAHRASARARRKGAAVSIVVCRGRRHRDVGREAELRADDDRVGQLGAQRLVDVPQRARPDLAVGVDLADEVLRVVLVAVDAPQAVRHRRRVRRRVPVGDARLVGRRREVLGDGHGQVVAERLADGAGIGGGAEAGHLVVLHRVAVLVDDDLGVLGVVDAALAQRDRELAGPLAVEGVVAAELVDAQQLLALVDRRQRRAEAQRLDVALGLGDPVVAHRLLELVLIAGVDEPAAGVGGRLARLADDLGVGAGERAGPVEVGQRHAVVGPRERRVGGEVVGVLLVGQRLDAEIGDRVGREDLGRRGRPAGRRLRAPRPRRRADEGRKAARAYARLTDVRRRRTALVRSSQHRPYPAAGLEPQQADERLRVAGGGDRAVEVGQGPADDLDALVVLGLGLLVAQARWRGRRGRPRP